MINKDLDLDKISFCGLMGMSEMETAVRRLLKYAQNSQINFIDCSFSAYIFLGIDNSINNNYGFTKDDHGLVGFCNLLAHGWLTPWYPNSCFKASSGLLERIHKIPELADVT